MGAVSEIWSKAPWMDFPPGMRWAKENKKENQKNMWELFYFIIRADEQNYKILT